MKVGEVAMGIVSTLGVISIALATLFRKSLAKKTGTLSLRGLQIGIGVLRSCIAGLLRTMSPGLPLGWLSWELSRHTCSALYREDKPRVDDTAVQAPIIRETSIDFASS
jgi:hypothetical protein